MASLATTWKSVPTPINNGLLFFAAHNISGSFESINANAYEPFTTFKASRKISFVVKASFFAKCAITFTTISVSVFPVKATSGKYVALSSWKFSITPLWTKVKRPSCDWCGCAFAILGTPCVAQRVCPIPICAGTSKSTTSRNSAMRPFSLNK